MTALRPMLQKHGCPAFSTPPAEFALTCLEGQALLCLACEGLQLLRDWW